MAENSDLFSVGYGDILLSDGMRNMHDWIKNIAGSNFALQHYKPAVHCEWANRGNLHDINWDGVISFF
jgi:hypothetical protein